MRSQLADSSTQRPERVQTLVHKCRVSFVIPALNEEANLPHVLSKLSRFKAEVIVVDGHSADRTVAVAREVNPGCMIVFESAKGKGAATRTGLAMATGDYVVLLDADCSHNPHEIEGMVNRLNEGFDVVHGSRLLPGGGSADITLFRFLGNKFFVWMTNFLHGTRYTDICYGYFAFRREALARLELTVDSMAIDTEILINSHYAGLRVTEVPSYELRRHSGRGQLNAVSDGWKIIKTITHEWLSRTLVSRRKPIVARSP